MIWREAHIYLHGQAQMDAFIAEDLPVIAADLDCATEWFFIRYWLGGPHVRLRLRSRCEDAAIGARLRTLPAARTAPVKLSREHFYRVQKFDGGVVDATDLPWFADGDVTFVDYVPETHFYGSGAELARSEALFCRSSQLAAAFVAGVAAAARPRLAAELLIGTLAYAEDGAEPFLARYRTFLAPFDESGALDQRNDWTGLKAQADHLSAQGNAMPGKGQMRPAYAWMQALKTWDASADAHSFRLVLLHHLMLNRIGVTPTTEARLLGAVTEGSIDAVA